MQTLPSMLQRTLLGFKTVADVTATEASTLRTILLNHAIGEVNLLQSRQVPLPQQGGGTLTYSPFKRSFTIKVVELQHLQIWLFQIFNVVME
jgi:hypothetical protein